MLYLNPNPNPNHNRNPENDPVIATLAKKFTAVGGFPKKKNKAGSQCFYLGGSPGVPKSPEVPGGARRVQLLGLPLWGDSKLALQFICHRCPPPSHWSRPTGLSVSAESRT